MDRFFVRLDDGFGDGANEDRLGLEGRDISEGGDRGEGQILEWSGDVGVVDAMDLVNPVDAELTDSVSHDLVRYESLGSLTGGAWGFAYPGFEDAIVSASMWEDTPSSVCSSQYEPATRLLSGKIKAKEMAGQQVIGISQPTAEYENFRLAGVGENNRQCGSW